VDDFRLKIQFSEIDSLSSKTMGFAQGASTPNNRTKIIFKTSGFFAHVLTNFLP
jgi:hypothetical protein